MKNGRNEVQTQNTVLKISKSNSFVLYIYILAGVPGVARDDQWRNRIAILCTMYQKRGDGINCGNVSE